MKKIIFLLLFCLIFGFLNAQFIKAKVLNNGGKSYSASDIKLKFSFGEIAISQFSIENKCALQLGFLHSINFNFNLKQHNIQMLKINSEQQSKDEIKVFPNPANKLATVIFNTNKSGKYALELTDVSGKLLKKITGESIAGENSIAIDVSRYPRGMYLVVLTNDEHGRKAVKLYKE